jgi:hypothetical protein
MFINDHIFEIFDIVSVHTNKFWTVSDYVD